MTEPSTDRDEATEALIAESQQLRDQLLVAVGRLDTFVGELRREVARRHDEGKGSP